MSPESVLPADPVSQRNLSEWLLFHGYAEEKRGYGHVSADELAEHLLERFAIWERHSDGTKRCADGSLVHDFKGQPVCPACGFTGLHIDAGDGCG